MGGLLYIFMYIYIFKELRRGKAILGFQAVSAGARLMITDYSIPNSRIYISI